MPQYLAFAPPHNLPMTSLRLPTAPHMAHASSKPRQTPQRPATASHAPQSALSRHWTDSLTRMRSRQRSDDGLSLSRDGPFCVHCSQVWYYYFQDPATAKRRAAESITIDHHKATNLRENELHGQPQVGKESPRTHTHSPPYSSTHAPGQNLSSHTSSLEQRDRSVTIYHSYDPPIRPTSTSPYGPLVAYSYG